MILRFGGGLSRELALGALSAGLGDAPSDWGAPLQSLCRLFVAGVPVDWKGFDGREISGLLNRPPATFTGKRPVLINIHGGPEAQATIGFLGRNNYYVGELGIALIQPNVRGSSGYGKTYVSLDDASPTTGEWNPGVTATNAKTAAEDTTTIAYLGDYNSGASAVSLPLINASGILQVSP